MNGLSETFLGGLWRTIASGSRACWTSWDWRLSGIDGGGGVEGVGVVNSRGNDALGGTSANSVGESSVTSGSGLATAVARSSTVGRS